MSQITVSHLTFAYDGACDNVFEDISFVLDTDWRLGFTGRNGRGKTTFLKLLDGTLDSRGAVRAGVPVLYFPFPVEYPEDASRAGTAAPGLPGLAHLAGTATAGCGARRIISPILYNE